MNIEELFDNELYHSYGLLTTDDANRLTNYLKEEVMEYVAGLEKRIAEFEGEVERLKTPSGELKNRAFEIPDPNIHELFSGERWNVGNSITTEDANSTLAYLESEVTQRIAARENGLKQRIVELESKLNRFLRGDFKQFCAYCGWESVDGTWDELQDHIHNCSKHPLGIANKRIAELERQQVAKVVKPKFLAEVGVYHCSCYTPVKSIHDYCSGCGAKLDWSKA